MLVFGKTFNYVESFKTLEEFKEWFQKEGRNFINMSRQTEIGYGLHECTDSGIKTLYKMEREHGIYFLEGPDSIFFNQEDEERWSVKHAEHVRRKTYFPERQ